MDDAGYCYPATPALLKEGMRPWSGPVSPTGYAVMAAAPPPKFSGQTVVCFASGPSLTAEDCELVRTMEFPAIAVNSSWQRAPFANVVFAHDAAWWRHHGPQVPVSAERWTSCSQSLDEVPGLKLMVQRSRACNSGALAIELADQLGASRIVLLGYDCSVKRGTHWHGDHTQTNNPDHADTLRWLDEFQSLTEVIAAEVVNCSRETALECFPRATLTQALHVK